VIAALIGFSTLLIGGFSRFGVWLGGFSRFGVWREIVIAFGLLLVLDGTRGTLAAQVSANANLWPILYLPSVIGGVIATLMLLHAANPAWRTRLLRRRAAA